MTPVLTGACIVVYAAMVASGVPWLWPTQAQLIDWGANQGIGIALNHEYWRLFTSVFLHGGMVQLAMNMWSLVVIGPLVERLYGNLAFAAIFLASGVGGAIASFAASSFRVGVGASGAICGVLGALVAFLIVHRRTLPKSILRFFRVSLLNVVILMAILGYFVPNIDQQAHLGGFFTGLFTGILLSRPWPVIKNRWATVRRLVAPLLFAGALAGLSYAVTRRAAAALSPNDRLQAIAEYLNPSLEEYDSINKGAPSTLILSRDQTDQEAREVHAKTVKLLIGRAAANLKRLKKVASRPYPPLHEMAQAMATAEAGQLASLRAAERYLGTGDVLNLSGPDGVLEHRAAAVKAERAFRELNMNFMRDNNLIKRENQPEASAGRSG
jgi:rhomboid protease GluP